MKIKFLLLLTALVVLAFAPMLKQKAKEETRPNIIFILTDDHRWDALGYQGNKIIQTPEMDKLAKEGIYFKKAFVTTPICMASRASILTGQYERKHGYTLHHPAVPDQFMENSYPTLIKKAGYYTGFFGKFGVKYDNKNQLFDVCESYDRKDTFPDRRGYFYQTIKGDTVHLTRYTGYKALEFIKNAPKDKPFCLSLSFSAPHGHDSSKEQYFWEAEQNDLYKDVVFPAPKLSDDKYFNEQPQYVREGENRKRWYWRFDTPEKYQQSMKGYYRMISGVDMEIKKIRTLLTEMGYDKNTIIIFTGDNGYFLGERQLADKWLMYDNSLRVPMMIYDPRNINHRDIEDMVLNIDIPSTILDFAGVEIPKKLQGRSLASYVKKQNPAESRNLFLCEHLAEYKPIPPSEGVRTKQWKYFRYIHDRPHEELYNLDKDPWEENNLAGNLEYKKILDELRSKCDSMIVQ